MEMRCRTCGYDLRGLEEHRCPECGRGFDPGDHRTFLRWPYRGRRYLFLAILACVLMVGAWFSSPNAADLGIGHLPLPGGFGLVTAALSVSSILLAWLVIAASYRAMTDRLPWAKERIAFAAALIISSLVCVGFVALMLGSILDRMID